MSKGKLKIYHLTDSYWWWLEDCGGERIVRVNGDFIVINNTTKNIELNVAVLWRNWIYKIIDESFGEFTLTVMKNNEPQKNNVIKAGERVELHLSGYAFSPKVCKDKSFRAPICIVDKDFNMYSVTGHKLPLSSK